MISDNEKSNDETEEVGQEPKQKNYRGVAITVGYLLLISSISTVTSIIYLSISRKENYVYNFENSQDLYGWLLQTYGTELLVFIAAMVFGSWGMRLIGTETRTPEHPSVIPNADRAVLEPLLKEKDGIENYVVLSSLHGFTGLFQKIGFSGLPLATVVLTLIFCALHFLSVAGLPFDSDERSSSAFLELAKLTTGAFIGSFVQKGYKSQSSGSAQQVDQILSDRNLN
ncbi:MAG: hypothetical protein AAF608_09520 [Pseudomonadota bacterium]